VSGTKQANFKTADTNNLIVAAKITGAGGVQKAGSSFSLGTVRFSNDTNDYTGDFTASFGNAEFTSVANQGTASSLGNGAAGTGGTITLANSSSFGVLRYVGAANSSTTRPLNWTATTGGYALDNTGSGTVQYLATGNLKSGSGSAGLTLQGTNTGSNTLAQVINDSGGTTAVTKSGTGKWVLTGSNTYSGGTTVSGGTLWVNNTGGSGTGSNTVSVTSGATLGGTGTIAGGVSVSTGSYLSPGNSPGNLTLNGGLTLAGTYIWELGALSTSNPGTDFDIITLTAGNADITGAALGLNLGAFAPSADPFWTTNQTWFGILYNTGSGILTGTFAAIDNSAWSSLGSFSTSVISGSNDVNLVWTAVPEPDTAALLGGFGVLALMRRRRS
jgi:autotransporter-associated beta strand protein